MRNTRNSDCERMPQCAAQPVLHKYAGVNVMRNDAFLDGVFKEKRIFEYIGCVHSKGNNVHQLDGIRR